jgi:hypothetical protein
MNFLLRVMLNKKYENNFLKKHTLLGHDLLIFHMFFFSFYILSMGGGG